MREHGGMFDGETYHDVRAGPACCLRHHRLPRIMDTFRPGCLLLLGSEAIGFDAHAPPSLAPSSRSTGNHRRCDIAWDGSPKAHAYFSSFIIGKYFKFPMPCSSPISRANKA